MWVDLIANHTAHSHLDQWGGVLIKDQMGVLIRIKMGVLIMIK